MDKKRKMDSKKPIEFRIDQTPAEHHLAALVPEFQKKYGLWIINSTLEYCADPDGFARCKQRKFDFYSISHLIDGGGRVFIEGWGEKDIEPGALIVITPGTLNRYGGNGKKFVEDALRFTGPVADMMAEAGVLRSGVYDIGTIRKLPGIVQLTEDPGTESQFKANMALQNLLADLYTHRRKENRSSRMEEILLLIHRELHSWLTVEELAERTSMSCEQLRKIFFAHTGMLPKSYIEHLKMRKAMEMLTFSNASIKDIANALGYSDPYHFSRRFKLKTGLSPEFYRKKLK